MAAKQPVMQTVPPETTRPVSFARLETIQNEKGDSMKANSLDCNENGPAKGKSVETTVCNIEEVNLFVEELEDVIAPRLAANHNETVVDDEEIDLSAEVLEETLAPTPSIPIPPPFNNHNETMARDDEEIELEVEELEDVIAPRLSANHNEAMVSDSK